MWYSADLDIVADHSHRPICGILTQRPSPSHAETVRNRSPRRNRDQVIADHAVMINHHMRIQPGMTADDRIRADAGSPRRLR